MRLCVRQIADLMTTADWFAVIAPLLLTAVIFLPNKSAQDGRRAVVEVDGQVVLEIDLAVDSTYYAKGPEGTAHLRIAEDEIWIAASPCRQQRCVAAGKIGRCGQAIVCVPNRLLVSIPGNAVRPYDAITE